MLAVLSLCIVQLIEFSKSMSPKIVGGDYPNITEFPHVASIKFKCVNDNIKEYFACGSTIINQEILLTAAHCMHECSEASEILVSVGHCNKKKGKRYAGHSFVVHDGYHAGQLVNDIALVRISSPITFSNTVQRVALMKDPPYKEKAQVAGWGLISEVEKLCGDDLKYVNQFVWNKNKCKETLNSLPKGTICAASQNEEEYASIGDSGSGLTVSGYIQLGVVSFKKPTIRRDLIVYTDVGYFYDWINKNTEYILCGEESKEDIKKMNISKILV